MRGGNSDAPFTLNLAFPAAVAQLGVHIKMKIQYPLFDLSEELPIDKSGLFVFGMPDEMGTCSARAVIDGVFSKQRRLYDIKGNKYRISKVSPEPNFSAFQRFLYKYVFSPIKKYEIELELVGESDLNELKDRITELVKHDPGDILLQFKEEDEWKEGIQNAKSFNELFDFVLKSIEEECEPVARGNG